MNFPLTAPGTWVYFLAAAPAAPVWKEMPQWPGQKTDYEILEIIQVRGKGGTPQIQPGLRMTRIENPEPIPSAAPEFKFKGTVRHLQYTPAAVRKNLTEQSAAPFSSGRTLAVLIPIRKSPAWWALSQDERQVHFTRKEGVRNHLHVGQEYASRIYRKLYHSRYMENETPLSYDFLTYFEFPFNDRPVFEKLLDGLRDTKHNPEWTFVDFEEEIWMEKKEMAQA